MDNPFAAVFSPTSTPTTGQDSGASSSNPFADIFGSGSSPATTKPDSTATSNFENNWGNPPPEVQAAVDRIQVPATANSNFTDNFNQPLPPASVSPGKTNTANDLNSLWTNVKNAFSTPPPSDQSTPSTTSFSTGNSLVDKALSTISISKQPTPTQDQITQMENDLNTQTTALNTQNTQISATQKELDVENQNLTALGKQIDSGNAEVEALNTNLDPTNQNSVDTYNAAVDKVQALVDKYNSIQPGVQAKINSFNNSITSYNASLKDNQTKAAAYSTAVDKFNDSQKQQVIRDELNPVNIIKGIIGSEVKPTSDEQSAEKEILGAGAYNTTAGKIVSAPIKGFIRFFEPIVQGLGTEIAGAILKNSASARATYGITPDLIKNIPGAHDTALQVAGNIILTGLSLYSPDIAETIGIKGATEAETAKLLQASMDASVQKSFAPIAKVAGQRAATSALNSAGIGLAFGTGQVLANGTTDPKEIASTILGSAVGLGLFGAVVTGGSTLGAGAKNYLLKDISAKYGLPATFTTNVDAINHLIATKQILPEDAQSMYEGFGLSPEQAKNVLNGKSTFSITRPLEDIFTVTDKPFWAKIKGAFGIDPSSKNISTNRVPSTITESPTPPRGITITGKDISGIANEAKAKAESDQAIQEKQKSDNVPQIIPTKNFRTFDFHELEGKPQTPAENAKIHNNIINDPDKPMTPGGESFNQAASRALTTIKQIMTTEKGNVAVTTHNSMFGLLKLWSESGQPSVLNQSFRDAYTKQDNSNPTGSNFVINGPKGDIYVVRHGETTDNAEGVFRRSNTQLTDKGRDEAKDLGTDLKGKGITKIYSSDLPRAIETSQIIQKGITENITKKPKTQFKSGQIRDLKSEEQSSLQKVKAVLDGKSKTEVIAHTPGFVSFDGKERPLILSSDIKNKITNDHGKISAENLVINANDWDAVLKNVKSPDGKKINPDKINLIKKIPGSNNVLVIAANRDNGFFTVTHYELISDSGNELKSLLGRGDLFNRSGDPLNPDSFFTAPSAQGSSEGVLGRGDNNNIEQKGKESQGSIIISAAKNIYGENLSNEKVSQKIIEDFGKYEDEKQNNRPSSFSNKLKDFFKKFYDFLKRIVQRIKDIPNKQGGYINFFESSGEEGDEFKEPTVEVSENPENVLEKTSENKEPEDIVNLREQLQRAQGYLDVAVSNQDQPIFKNKIPALKAEVNNLRSRIATIKNPPIETGNKISDARTILQAVEDRTGVTTTGIPTIKVDDTQVPLPPDIYEKELLTAFKGEAIKENPLNSLWKYSNKKEGTLPEVTGKATSQFGKSGDDIVAREEFQRFADENGQVDAERVREEFSKFVVEKRAFQDELQDLKKQRRQFVDKARQDIAEKKKLQERAEKYGFIIPEYDAEKQGIASIPDLIAAEDALKIHPGRPFMKYSNPRTGLLPIIDPEHPGVYGKEMTTLLNKKGFASVAEAQKAVDNYLAHVDQLFLMSEDAFNPLELVQSNSVKLTPAFETEKARLESDPSAKPLQTIVDQSEKYPLKKKAGALDLLTTPEYVYNKIGLADEYAQLNKAYYNYLKELPANIQKITEWSKSLPKEIDGRPVAERIFDYLNNSGSSVNENGFVKPDFLTAPEIKVATEIKKWLGNWADRLHLPMHERLNNYITHIFEDDLIKKEFDEDLAKIIRDKIPGETYDPFLEQRIGAMGYRRNVWSALQAYVKRATRKVNMDPALEQIKIASSKLDDYTKQYVLKHIGQVNLRPTDLEKGIDTSIKQTLAFFHINPYTFSSRPTARITTTVRRAISRATFGLNAKTALKVLTQGVNTYAIIGEKNTALGYAKLMNGENWQELKSEGIIGKNIATQDRVLSATKKFWEKTDKALFYFLTTAENINRGAAYFGAKAKYYDENTRIDKGTGQRIYQDGADEQKAKDYARDLVEKTQFMYNPLTTPVALGGTIGKTAAQLQMFTLKESEFLGGLAKDKNWKAIFRYLGASIVLMYAMSKLFKTAWGDVIPLFRFSLIPPIVSIPQQLTQAALGTPDQYGVTPSVKTRIQNAVYAGTSLIPAGVQTSNTIKGIQSTRFNASIAEQVRAAIFGPSPANTSDIVQKSVSRSASTASTALSKLDPSIVKPAEDAWAQVKKVGPGTDAGDAIVSNLTDPEYAAYKNVKAADTTYWTSIAEKVTPIVQQAQALGFGSDKADALVSPLSDDEYAEYGKIKTALYGSDTGGDIAGTQPISKETLITRIGNYAKAIGTDPVSAFDDIFHGQVIKELKNGQIIVERMSLQSSQAIKKSEGGENANFKLDHAIPLEVGGTNEKYNLQLISTADWEANTPIEDYLGQELDNGNITGAKAREYAIRYKAGVGEPLSPQLQKEYKTKYNSQPITFDQIKSEVGN